MPMVIKNEIKSPLGPMVAIADEKALYLLEFIERKNLKREIKLLQEKNQSAIISGHTDPIISIEEELSQYFEGKLFKFQTPIAILGTPFRQRVWEELQRIPFGKTISYAELAIRIGNPKACRAVAQANGANQLAIIIPCHRVINADGKLGGYGGGIARKQWLLNHER